MNAVLIPRGKNSLCFCVTTAPDVNSNYDETLLVLAPRNKIAVIVLIKIFVAKKLILIKRTKKHTLCFRLLGSHTTTLAIGAGS
jgi:hypothetical protein